MISALLALSLMATPGAIGQPACAPTRPDALGPFYKNDAPARSSTGHGLVVSGRVRSAAACAPLASARLEWWSANTRGEYENDHRATQTVDSDGRFRYETDFPGRYPGRPPHLHARVTAPGHRVLITQLYPKTGDTSLSVDFVLQAE